MPYKYTLTSSLRLSPPPSDPHLLPLTLPFFHRSLSPGLFVPSSSYTHNNTKHQLSQHHAAPECNTHTLCHPLQSCESQVTTLPVPSQAPQSYPQLPISGQSSSTFSWAWGTQRSASFQGDSCSHFTASPTRTLPCWPEQTESLEALTSVRANTGGGRWGQEPRAWAGQGRALPQLYVCVICLTFFISCVLVCAHQAEHGEDMSHEDNV